MKICLQTVPQCNSTQHSTSLTRNLKRPIKIAAPDSFFCISFFLSTNYSAPFSEVIFILCFLVFAPGLLKTAFHALSQSDSRHVHAYHYATDETFC